MAAIVAVLGRGVVPADEPLLAADDLGVLRGDGVFETLNVRAGQPFLLDEHLARMARSAQRMELTLPSADRLRELAGQACAAFGDRTEGALRLICTRGREDGGDPTVYATVNPVPTAAVAARHNGVSLITTTLGVTADARAKAPWLMGGVKFLSYAVAMGVQRYARAAGYDDALWVSSDGYALEGPTSTLIWLDGDTLCTVPTDTGILPGTTSAYVLEGAGAIGLRTAERMITPGELTRVDGAWMTSSVRGVAHISRLDDVSLSGHEIGAELQKLAGFPDPVGR